MTAVTVSRMSGYTHRVCARGHELVTDEPQTAGGADEGPSPWEYLLAGMGACTAMTIEMYAERKEWKVDDVHVKLRRDPGSGQVELDVSVSGDLTQEQLERLEQIAHKCPVVKAVQNGIAVEERVRLTS